jgi:hypothetical protein
MTEQPHIEGKTSRMAMLLSYWERRGNVDREKFGNAAPALCRASRTRPGFRSTRFSWVGIDTVVSASDVETLEAADATPSPEGSRAAFALSHLARQVRTERWQDAARSAEAHRTGQR